MSVVKPFFLSIFLMVSITVSHAQTLIAPDDYGPVFDQSSWVDSRMPGLTCEMPKANQIPVPLCDDCLVLDARPHMDDPTLAIIDLETNVDFATLVDFYSVQTGFNYFPATSNDRKAYFVTDANRNFSRVEFLTNLAFMPHILVSDSRSLNGFARHIVMVLPHSNGYTCVFDPDA